MTELPRSETLTPENGLAPIGTEAEGTAAGGFTSPVTPAAVSTSNPARPELVEGPAYIPVRAMEAVMAKRGEQIHKFGHTLEADLARPLQPFAIDIESLARSVLEDVQFHKSRAQLRRRLVKLGALTLAMIDRVDGEGDCE